ncbi:hypothetical protein ACFYNO_25170 [Kitasatospora sp. NPDC006697]|uniref:hypothetical protein n=1 Tax=Kitasatospora sp. NPDC006697 TaxID=3364020 RepID=UPI0036C82837
MSKLRIPAAAGAVLASVALLSGCQSSPKPSATAAVSPPAAAPSVSASDTASAPAAPSSSAPAAAASPSDSSGGSAPASPAGGGGAVPTGTALKAMLPAAATLPSGWTLDGSGNEFDTGTNIMDPGVPQLPQNSCKGWTNQGAEGLSVDYRASYASINLSDANKASVSVVIAAYHPGDAAKLLAEIRTSADGCKSYQADTLGGGQTQMALSDSPVAGLGDESALLKNVPQGHFVSQENLVVRLGDKVLLLDGSDAGSGQLPDLTTLAQALVKNIK